MNDEIKNFKGIVYILFVWGICFLINFMISTNFIQPHFWIYDYNNYSTMIGTSIFILFWIYMHMKSRNNKTLLKLLLGLNVYGVILGFLCLMKVASLIEILNWPYMVVFVGLENFISKKLYFIIQTVIFLAFSLFTVILLLFYEYRKRNKK